MSDKSENKIDDLQFVRIFTPVHIPVYLVDQIKDRDFTIDQFYKYQEINCVRQTDNGPILNPLNLLYVIVNKEKIPKGFCWMAVDALTNDLVIQNYSIDKDYWYKGEAVKFLSKKVKEIVDNCKYKRVFWITKYPKHSKHYGFKPSKHILMEWKEEQENGSIE